MLKIILIFLGAELLIQLAIPTVFVLTSGPDGARQQVMVMSNLGQGLLLLIACRFIKDLPESEEERRPKNWTAAVACGFICMALAFCNYMFFDGVDLIRIAITDDAALINRYNATPSAQESLLIVLSYIIVPAVGEEAFFRKMTESRMRKKYNETVMIVFCSLLFALSHMSIVKFLPMFLLSLVLTAYYVKYKNIAVCIIVHLIYNLISIAIEYQFPLPSSSYYIATKYASADEAVLWGIRFATLGLTAGAVAAGLYYRHNRMKSVESDVISQA